MYYIIVKDDKVVDAIENRIKLRYIKRVDRWITIDSSDDFDGVLSRDNSIIWDLLRDESISMKEVTEDYYSTILENLVSSEEPLYLEVEETEISIEELSLEFVKRCKISEMSDECNKKIIYGIDVSMIDGNIEHFDLTYYDQLNLLELQNMLILNGDIYEIPYHSKDKECKYYSQEEILRISDAAREYKTYHISYFNSLKSWILSIDNIEDISKIYYGIEIPKEFISDVLKDMSELSDMSS